MILSHQRGFIFLKAIKTASTSVEIALSKYCGPDDVITELPDPDETIRRSLGYRGPQNHLHPLPRRLMGRILGQSADRRRYKFHHNVTAVVLKRSIRGDDWSRKLKFSIVRNPFDRAISKFYNDHRHEAWDKRREGRDYSPEYISKYISGLPDQDLTNWHIYADGDDLLVDHVIRYEELGPGLNALLGDLGIDDEIQLVEAKGNFRLNRDHYSRILDPTARRRIETVAAREISRFGYPWESR